MDFAIHWVDVSEGFAKKEQPTFLLKRSSAPSQEPRSGPLSSAGQGEYWTAVSSLVVAGPKFVLATAGDFVRIPIEAYRVPRAQSSILALGMQLGSVAAVEVAKLTSKRIVRIELVLGHECMDLYPEGQYRCFAGVSFRVE